MLSRCFGWWRGSFLLSLPLGLSLGRIGKSDFPSLSSFLFCASPLELSVCLFFATRWLHTAFSVRVFRVFHCLGLLRGPPLPPPTPREQAAARSLPVWPLVSLGVRTRTSGEGSFPGGRGPGLTALSFPSCGHGWRSCRRSCWMTCTPSRWRPCKTSSSASASSSRRPCK